MVCIWEPVFRFLNLAFPIPSLFLFPRQPGSLSMLGLKRKLYAWSPVLYTKYIWKQRDSPLDLQISVIITTVNSMYVLKFEKIFFFWFKKISQCYFQAYMKPAFFSISFLKPFNLSIQSNCIVSQLSAYSNPCNLLSSHF